MRIPRTRQPQAAIRIHPYWARGVTSAIIGSLPGGEVSWGFSLTRSNVTDAALSPGRVFSFSEASNSYIDAIHPEGTLALTANTSFSVVALIRSSSSSANPHYILNQNYNGSSVCVNLSIGNNSGFASTDGMAFFNGSWTQSGVTTRINGDGAWHLVGGTIDNIGGSANYYLDGKLDKSSAFGAGATSAANSNALTWGRYKNDAHSLTGEIAFGVFWDDRLLSAAEMYRLWTNPWQLFHPSHKPSLFGVTAAAGAGSNHRITGGGWGGRVIADQIRKAA